MFKKDNVPWNKGKPMQQSSRDKLSNSMKELYVKGVKMGFQTGHSRPAWNKGITMSPEQLKIHSEIRMGQKPWNKGKHYKLKTPHSEEHRKKISQWMKRPMPENTKMKISEKIKILHAKGVKMGGFYEGHPDYSPNAPQKQKGHKPSEEALRKWAIGCRMKPTKPERILIKIIAENGFPYKYVGDGFTWIAGKNPDFMNVNGQKKLIEVFGRYWHENEDENIRKTHFAKYGFKTLVIWDDELDDLSRVIETIKKFEGDIYEKNR